MRTDLHCKSNALIRSKQKKKVHQRLIILTSLSLNSSQCGERRTPQKTVESNIKRQDCKAAHSMLQQTYIRASYKCCGLMGAAQDCVWNSNFNKDKKTQTPPTETLIKRLMKFKISSHFTVHLHEGGHLLFSSTLSSLRGQRSVSYSL